MSAHRSTSLSFATIPPFPAPLLPDMACRGSLGMGRVLARCGHLFSGARGEAETRTTKGRDSREERDKNRGRVDKSRREARGLLVGARVTSEANLADGATANDGERRRTKLDRTGRNLTKPRTLARDDFWCFPFSLLFLSLLPLLFRVPCSCRSTSSSKGASYMSLQRRHLFEFYL
jgi:hypothetical protein